MADIHVLNGSAPDADGVVTTRLVFHYAIPAPDQVAEASQDPELVAFVSEVPDISQSERSAIKAGEGVEEIAAVSWHPSEPQATTVARIRAAYTARKADAVAVYKVKYRAYLTTLSE